MNPVENSCLKFVPVDSTETEDQFRKLLLCLFPVAYPKSFFKDIFHGKISAFVCFLRDTPIGCVSWKLSPDRNQLEILNFGVLVLQRRKGFGSQILDFIINNTKVEKMSLHVHVANEEAIQFYVSKGFTKQVIVERYYPRLEPPSAWKMEFKRV